MKKDRGHERGGRRAEEVEQAGRPKIPRDAVEDLQPQEEQADRVKGGVRKAGKEQHEY